MYTPVVTSQLQWLPKSISYTLEHEPEPTILHLALYAYSSKLVVKLYGQSFTLFSIETSTAIWFVLPNPQCDSLHTTHPLQPAHLHDVSCQHISTTYTYLHNPPNIFTTSKSHNASSLFKWGLLRNWGCELHINQLLDISILDVTLDGTVILPITLAEK